MTSNERQQMRAQLVRHESLRLKPYRDTVGKLTIGVGRNLDDVGITADEAAMMLDHDIDRCIVDLSAAFHWFIDLGPVRQRVWIDLCFNMGIAKLHAFTNTIAAMARGDYASAADGLQASKWYGQVGTRGPRLVEALRHGTDPE